MYEIIIVGATEISDGNQVIKYTDKDGVELWIPMDEANADYQAYLTWLAEQSTPKKGK